VPLCSHWQGAVRLFGTTYAISKGMSNQRVFPYDFDCHEDDMGPPSTLPAGPAQPTVANAISTLVSGADGDRTALIGALAFMERAASDQMQIADLVCWFDEYLVRPGHMERPSYAVEYAETRVFIGPTDASLTQIAREHRLAHIVRAARKRVLATLSALLTKQDDRFLYFLTGSGRVWPYRMAPKRMWGVSPRPDDALSDIVLSLFAADILANRRLYEERLSVCEACGRISFRPNSSRRNLCREHEASTFSRLLRIFS